MRKNFNRYILLFLFSAFLIAVHGQTIHDKVIIHGETGQAVRSFIPAQCIGAAFDGHAAGDIKKMLLPENVSAMHSLGFHPLSYRLRTELGNEAWHWNPHGTWSETGKQQGYWTSDSFSKSPISITNGYRLPRRGNTHDQANDDGYSMLDDGNEKSIWKSNPYLDPYYTGDDDSLHMQWVVIDLGKEMPVNTIEISWANPYAQNIFIDYASDIGSNFFDPYQPKMWKGLPVPVFQNQGTGKKLYAFSSQPVMLRFIRVQMMHSSHTSDVKGNDIRNELGFAIREIRCGVIRHGVLKDIIHHARDNNKQTNMLVSSTDPWHRAIDRHPDVEQAGVDLFFQSGLPGTDPVMFPLGILYDTPDNMRALVRYILSKKYTVTEIELGEEPDGQRTAPADYAALYCRFARMVKELSPSLKIGGPSFATLATWEDDPDNYTERKWMRVFLDYLDKHQCLSLFNFFSFEWYPFDDICAPTAPQLLQQPEMLRTALSGYRDHVLPNGVPIYITEYGYSAHSGKAQVDIEGALMYPDINALALLLGVDRTYLYGYEPSQLGSNAENCSWGNNMLFAMNDAGKIVYKVAAYYGVNMMLKNWLQFSDSLIGIYPAEVLSAGPEDSTRLVAYALKKPGDKWSVLLINKDPKLPHTVEINMVDDQDKKITTLHYPLGSIQYSSAQYRWLDDKDNGHPLLNLPPLTKTINEKELIELPPYSLTVINE
jgi:hypothetical protein